MAGDAARRVDLLEEGEWDDMQWSDEEDAIAREEQRVYTQTNDSPAKRNSTSNARTPTRNKRETTTETPEPPPQRRRSPSPTSYALHATPQTPASSTPRRLRRPDVDDSEIMQHLVGGMAGLGVDMSLDDGGRWRIRTRR